MTFRMQTMIQSAENLKNALEYNEQLYWNLLYYTHKYTTELPSYASMIHSALAVTMPQVDVLAFNRVIGLGMGDVPSAQQLEESIRFYKAAQTPRFFAQVSPLFLTPTLEDNLKAYGFRYYNNWVKLFRKASGPLPKVDSKLKIVEVKAEQALLYGKLLVKAFAWPEVLAYALARTVGLPGYRQYFALEREEPVAAAALFIHRRYASLAIAGTLPEHTGKGAQSALLAKRITVAQRLGCHYVIGETAEDKIERPVTSYRNMRRFGLEVAYLRPNYIYYCS